MTLSLKTQKILKLNYMSDDFEKTVIGKCLSDESYARTVLPHLEKHYFENEACQNVFKHLIQYMIKYNRRPSRDSLSLNVDDSETKALLKHIDKYAKKQLDPEWLLNQTEEWCSTRAIENAIIKSIAIIDGKDQKHSKGSIPEMLKNALAISFNPAIGHDWSKDAETRHDAYNKHIKKLPFDLAILNEVTNGGIEPGTLNVLMSGTHGGKTLMMCHCAAHHLALGKNVLYITMEMGEEKIAERIDANLLDIDIDDLQTTEKDFFMNRVSSIAKKTAGRLMIKQYPTTQANVNHFRALINDYKTKLDFIPDVVYIDYLNICGCARLKGGTYKSYDFVKAIAEEIRGLAIEKKFPIISATQTNRCLSPETKVVEKEKGEIELSQVKIGDSLLSENNKWNTVQNKWEDDNEMYEITTKSGKKIICSAKHLFPVDGELASIENGKLKIESKLSILKMKDEIVSIKKLGKQKSIDVELDGDRLFFANDILTHNSGFSDSDVEITSTSDSFGVPQTADMFWAIIKNEALDSENKVMIKQLKNRYKDLAYKRRFMLGLEIKKMRFYELDDPTQGVTQTDDTSNDDSPSQFSLQRQKARREINL